MNKLQHILTIFFCTILLQNCTEESYTYVDEYPPIYPDYCEVTVPVNIAPLNFMIRDGEIISVTREAVGDTIIVEVKAKVNGKNISYRPFHIYVSPDSIDKYLSYREIEPGYEVWDNVKITQRNVENFDETTLSKGSLCKNGCMNCHTYNKKGQSFFHLRTEDGGTILNDHGRLRKIETRTPLSSGPAVYGDLDNTGRYGIFTSNTIIPALHAIPKNRLEVYDTEAELLLIDFQANTIRKVIPTDSTTLVTFPTFTPDGRKIIFCEARRNDSNLLRYSILAIDFDPESGATGDTITTIWDAEKYNLSASFPKVSPDGKWLLFTTSADGTFPIWRREADLAMMNMETGERVDISNVNSSLSDTYHSWSSNSQWFVFASKRDDGVYGKPYFVHVSDDGTTSKPLLLPQKNPEKYDNTLISYNIPELSPISTNFNAFDIAKILSTETEYLSVSQ